MIYKMTLRNSYDLVRESKDDEELIGFIMAVLTRLQDLALAFFRQNHIS